MEETGRAAWQTSPINETMNPGWVWPLPAVERLSPSCIRILGGNPGKFTLQGTNTYLLGSGRRRILIDTGEGRPAWIASLRSTLEREKATVETVLISHGHRDHIGGIHDLLCTVPAAKIYKHTPEVGQRALKDGQKFQVDGATVTASHTPGHCRDHMVFCMAEEDAMFTADNVLGHGTAVFEELDLYIESLHKMATLFSGRAYPGHGTVVEDGRGKIAEYIEHRQRRQDEILRTMLPSGAAHSNKTIWMSSDIVRAVYGDLPPELEAAARGGVRQMLSKLEQEGKVRRDGEDQWLHALFE